MTIKLELPARVEEHLRERAAEEGVEPADYVQSLVEQHLMTSRLEALRNRKGPSSIVELRARKPSPPGMSWIDAVSGQWPGHETDEEINAALEEMS